MAKTRISEYDSTAANNTDIDGVNLAEGCPPSGINNAIRESMAHLKDFQTGASGDNLTVGGNLNLQGELQLNASAGTSGQFLTSQGSGSDPTWTTLTAFVSGMIMMWSGTIATIPSGWLLCDGTSGTPDLRDKFVIGARADDGGAAKTNVTGSYTQTGGSKDAVVVSHSHTATSNTVGDHAHSYTSPTDPATGSGTGGVGGGATQNFPSTNGATTTGAGSHSHTITVSSAGVSGTNANLPPYYALAFIMKS
jgi:hypothetical protein